MLPKNMGFDGSFERKSYFFAHFYSEPVNLFRAKIHIFLLFCANFSMIIDNLVVKSWKNGIFVMTFLFSMLIFAKNFRIFWVNFY